MKLFIIGLIIGIGKVIPGVSGAMLAISFGIYEKTLNSITNFFNNPKENFKFLLTLGIGIIFAIIFSSKLIVYLLNNYYFITMMFFLGLIITSIFNYGQNLKYTIKSITSIVLITLVFLLLTFNNNIKIYELTGNYQDSLIFFLGGIIEIISSLVPGISGTALLMNLGIYEHTLTLFSSIYNLNYVITNLNLYLSYGVGMIISFIIVTYSINYLFKKYRNITELFILSFTISSIILLIKTINFNNLTLLEYSLGIISLLFGLFVGNKGLEKK